MSPAERKRVLNYEHLVQINDPLNPMLETISREELWQGLVLRAEQPQLFVMGLDDCRIVSRAGDVFERELHYGPALVRDQVTLIERNSVRYDIAATSEHVGGSLTMTIEQPDELQMFVRFQYRTTLPEVDATDTANPALTSEIIKSAYREADIDTIRTIRQMAQAGRLGNHPLH